jgi:hypothetical protein
MDRYPRITVRLTRINVDQLRLLAVKKHCTRGEIVRKAIEQYFSNHSMISKTDNDVS